MKVNVRLKEQSQPITIDNAVNTYQKGDFFCVYRSDEVVSKYPICAIFDVKEDYGTHE